MAIGMSVTMPNGNGYPVQVEAYPDTCPVCHHALSPLFLVARALSDEPVTHVDAVFQCTKGTCRRVFVGRYYQLQPGSRAPLKLKEAVPLTARRAAFSAEISGVSPTFVEVFDQVQAAEAGGLDQLVGMGLRKALEFLVKDYALSKAASEDEKEAIKKKLLGKCIEDHIKDATVQKAAKLATWLGNDETHYVRRWEDKDINDLKKLVRLTVNAVENALLTDRYAKEMPEGR